MTAMVSRLEFRLLMWWVILGTGIVTMPFAIAHFTIHDGWLSPIMFLIGSLIAVGVSTIFMHTFPGCTLTEGCERAFGPWIGRVSGLWILIMMYLAQCMIMRELSLFVEANILPQTPSYITSALIVFPLSYAKLKNLNILGRLSEFITPLALISTAIVMVLAIARLDLSQLQPVLEYGWRPVYRGGLLPETGFAFQLVLFVQFIRNSSKPKTIPTTMIRVAVEIFVFLVIQMFFVICILGRSAAYLNYPVLELVRSIRILDFLERFDTIYAMGVVVVIIIKLGVWGHAWLIAIKDVFKIPDEKELAIASSCVIWAGSIFFFHDALELSKFMLYVTPTYFGLTLVGLPLLAVSIGKMRKLTD